MTTQQGDLFHHPFRMDTAILQQVSGLTSGAGFVPVTQLPANVRVACIDPTVFTHAYVLLGTNPQRFASDLTLYLATVRAFFERANPARVISMPANANADSRRRLSEDLGVAFASYFTVAAFGVTWESISQIPQNARLSKKRPDFQGFTGSAERHLFEAKGTTHLRQVEPMLSKAIGQVKQYPEQASAKTAIVSYLSGDDRFFPSTSFVVDPPSLPDTVEPDVETSRLLHFEKVLQFAGFSETAKHYVAALAQKFRIDRRRREGEEPSRTRLERLAEDLHDLEAQLSIERQGRSVEIEEIEGEQIIGRSITDRRSGTAVFFGVRESELPAGLQMGPRSDRGSFVKESDGVTISSFGDGTVLRISISA